MKIEQRFVRGDLVGKGGSGRVHRAVDLLTGEAVALKLLSRDDARAVERFEQEARALADITHPHVVRYVAHGVTEEGELFLAMEWLEGETLARRLARGPLSLEETLDLGRAVAGALAAAHARGLIHRDIKPSNLVLVDSRPAGVRLLDFGVVFAPGTSQSDTHAGGMIGTLGYMAPEQARSDRGIVDERADVFSLGAVLFECLTGRRAFDGAHAMAVLAQLILAEVPRVREILPGAPPALDALIARMLAKEPDARPASAAEVARELDAVAAGAPESVALSGPPRSITGVERRLIAVVALQRARADAGRTGEIARGIAARHGAPVFELAGGAVLVTLSEQMGATEQAAAAARCALRLRAALPDASMALVMGRGEATGRLPIGPVVERAAELLLAGAVEPGAVRIDEVTHALLDGRFEVRAEAAGLLLAGENAIGEGARTLLGRPTPYVGRERELRFVAEMARATFDGERPAQALIVTATAGMGKTRLRHELVKGLHAQRPEVLVGVGRADAMSAGSAFVALGAAVRSALGVTADLPPPQARELLVERVGAFVQEDDRGRVAAFVGELIGVPMPADFDPDLAAARKSGARMADEIERAFVELLRGACGAGPVLLVLEDMHWGDPGSVRLVDRALRELSQQPLMVLALGRPEVHEIFPGLWSKRDAQSLRLTGLPRRAAEELATRSLRGAISEADRARIVAQAGGNAFYLEELIRALAEGRGDGLPETVLGMVEARIDALPAEARRLLRAASVFGETFSKSGALALIAEHERAEADRRWLPWLVEQELIVRRDDRRGSGDEEHAFRHALVREASYAMLTPADRELGHRLAGEWMLGAGAAGGDARSSVVGEHFDRAGDWEAAAAAFERAGDAAAGLHVNAEARAHYQRALDAAGKLHDSVSRERLRVAVMIKKVAVSYGDDPGPNLALLAEAERVAAALPETASPPSDDYRLLARVHYWMGRCHWYHSSYSEAIGYYERTIAAARLLGDGELAATPSGTIGRVMMARGRFAAAVPYLERSLGPLEQGSQWVDWVVNAANRAVTMSAAGRAAEAVAEGERVVAKAREIRSPTSESVACVNLGLIHVLLGAPGRAVPLLEVAAERAERSGDRVYAYLAYGFATWAEARLDHHEAAVRHIGLARAIMAEMGRRLFYADWFDAFAMEAAQRAGRSTEVLSEAARVAGELASSDSLFAEGLVRRAWGLATAAEGGPLDEALVHLSRSLELFTEGGARVEEARTRIGIALVHRRRGDMEAVAREASAASRILAPIGAGGEIEAGLEHRAG